MGFKLPKKTLNELKKLKYEVRHSLIGEDILTCGKQLVIEVMLMNLKRNKTETYQMWIDKKLYEKNKKYLLKKEMPSYIMKVIESKLQDNYL